MLKANLIMIEVNLIMDLVLKDKTINVDEEHETSKTNVPSIKIKSTKTMEHISRVVVKKHKKSRTNEATRTPGIKPMTCRNHKPFSFPQ